MAVEMRLRTSSLLSNFSIQPIGTLSSMALVLLLARYSGPEIQGQYSSIRAWADMSATFFLFGFPQLFVILINQNRINRQSAKIFCYRYSILCFVFVCVINLFWMKNPIISLYDFSQYQVLTISLLTYSFILHGSYRAVFLTVNDSYYFALYTIMPNAALLIIVTSTLALGQGDLFFAFNALSLTLFLLIIVFNEKRREASRFFETLKIMASEARFTMYAFVDSFMLVLQPAAILLLSAASGASAAQQGLLAVLIIPLQIGRGLISPILPVLFNAWSGTQGPTFRAFSLRRIAWCCIAIVAITALSALVIPRLLVFVAGPQYTSLLPSLGIMCVALPAIIANRIMATMLLSRRKAGASSAIVTAQTALLIVMQFVIFGGDTQIVFEYVALAWVFAIYLTSFIYSGCLQWLHS